MRNPLMMAVCLSEEGFIREMKRMRIPKEMRPNWVLNKHSDATAHFFENDKGIAVVVCLRGWENRDPLEVAGLIVHEAVHIWQEVRSAIGEKNPSSEFEAYSIQSISQSLMSGFVKARKKIAC